MKRRLGRFVASAPGLVPCATASLTTLGIAIVAITNANAASANLRMSLSPCRIAIPADVPRAVPVGRQDKNEDACAVNPRAAGKFVRSRRYLEVGVAGMRLRRFFSNERCAASA